MKNRFQKYLSLTVALLIMACMFSCRKPQPQGSSVDGGFKSFFDYQVGSYWIFYDSIVKKYDSLYVTEYSDQAANGLNFNELVSISMYEYYFDSISGGKLWSLILAGPSTASLIISYGYPEMGYNIFAESTPFYTGVVSDPKAGYSQATSLMYSRTIRGNAYNNVYEIIYKYSTNNYADTFYINSTYGFLAVLLNNEYTHQRLFLTKSNIIR